MRSLTAHMRGASHLPLHWPRGRSSLAGRRASPQCAAVSRSLTGMESSRRPASVQRSPTAQVHRPAVEARLTMHPDLAYGSAGCNGGAVPAAGMASISPVDGAAGSGLPSGSLSYEVELLDVGRSPTGEEEDLSPEECLQRAMRAKDAGNTHFKAGDLQLAAETYMGALRLLGHSDTKEGSEELNREQDFRWSDSARREARDRLLLACCLNLTQCELKLDRFLEAFNHATAALGLDPNSSKALYRRGLAALGSGLLDQAKTDLVKAARLEPKNGEIRSQLQACQQRIQESEQKDRSTFGGMFGRGYLYGEKDAGEGREA
uniref:peptidylprolyl isomerase n=1 Tax=Alexandrium monilatum TaxID=311494 RepID=A0A7S4PSK0_9DINO